MLKDISGRRHRKPLKRVSKWTGALKRLEYEAKIAGETERKIKASLAPLVDGEQYVQAIVHGEADFDSMTREEIPINSQISISKNTKEPTNTGLLPGTASNVTASTELDSQGRDLEVKVTPDSTKVKNLVSQRTVSAETAPGKINRLTTTAIIGQKNIRMVNFSMHLGHQSRNLSRPLKMRLSLIFNAATRPMWCPYRLIEQSKYRSKNNWQTQAVKRHLARASWPPLRL